MRLRFTRSTRTSRYDGRAPRPASHTTRETLANLSTNPPKGSQTTHCTDIARASVNHWRDNGPSQCREMVSTRIDRRRPVVRCTPVVRHFQTCATRKRPTPAIGTSRDSSGPFSSDRSTIPISDLNAWPGLSEIKKNFSNRLWPPPPPPRLSMGLGRISERGERTVSGISRGPRRTPAIYGFVSAAAHRSRLCDIRLCVSV